MAMKRSRYCCGASVDTAAYIVALAELIMGALAFTIFFLVKQHLCYGQELDEDCEDMFTTLSDLQEAQGLPQSAQKDKIYKNIRAVYYWLFFVCAVVAGIQCGMAIFLAIGVKMKSQPMCIIWLIATGATCTLIGCLIRIFEMFVVHDFYRQLSIEQRLTNLSGSGGTPGGNNNNIAKPNIPRLGTDSLEISKKPVQHHTPFPADIQC